MSGGGFAHDIAGGQGALIIAALHSPNFVHGSAGWSINKDGSAEFNNGTFRGTITAGVFKGADFIINSSGAYFYSGTPASGNLIASIASSTGTDGFGNAILSGIGSYGTSGSPLTAVNLISGNVAFFTASTQAGPWSVKGQVNWDTVNNALLITGSGQPIELFGKLSSTAALGVQETDSNWVFDNPIAAAHPGSPGTPETWQTMTLLNSWTAAARITPKYRIVAAPPNTTEIIGSLTAPAGIVAGQVIWNLPANYTVSGLQSVVARNVTTNAAVMLSVVTGSPQTLQFQAGAVAGNIIDFHAFLSQDA